MTNTPYEIAIDWLKQLAHNFTTEELKHKNAFSEDNEYNEDRQQMVNCIWNVFAPFSYQAFEHIERQIVFGSHVDLEICRWARVVLAFRNFVNVEYMGVIDPKRTRSFVGRIPDESATVIYDVALSILLGFSRTGKEVDKKKWADKLTDIGYARLIKCYAEV